jgi:hypothetical protein
MIIGVDYGSVQCKLVDELPVGARYYGSYDGYDIYYIEGEEIMYAKES